MVVASKFDNRLKEFGERWEVDRYLSAAGYLSANVRPFFVALPKVSNRPSPPSCSDLGTCSGLIRGAHARRSRADAAGTRKAPAR